MHSVCAILPVAAKCQLTNHTIYLRLKSFCRCRCLFPPFIYAYTTNTYGMQWNLSTTFGPILSCHTYTNHWQCVFVFACFAINGHSKIAQTMCTLCVCVCVCRSHLITLSVVQRCCVCVYDTSNIAWNKCVKRGKRANKSPQLRCRHTHTHTRQILISNIRLRCWCHTWALWLSLSLAIHIYLWMCCARLHLVQDKRARRIHHEMASHVQRM